MFPGGAAGYGLLILRLCAAGMLVWHSLPSEATASAFCMIAGAIVIALLLSIGLFTPVCCGLSCLVQIVLAVHHPIRDAAGPAFALLITLALFLLGPGGFSVDSRLFGRRLVIRS